jgi:hypothetical protein
MKGIGYSWTVGADDFVGLRGLFPVDEIANGLAANEGVFRLPLDGVPPRQSI